MYDDWNWRIDRSFSLFTDDFYQSYRLREDTPFFIISSGLEQESYGIMCLTLPALTPVFYALY